MAQEGKEWDEESTHGCKVIHKLIRLDMCTICGDEVNGNLSMKGDGNIGKKNSIR